MIWLTGFFALVALIYASVGFGGGSTYTALLGLWGVDYRIIPVISLLCNIIVVTGGTARFIRAGLVKWPQVVPLLLVSAPLAFVGGLVPLKQWLFFLILGSALLLSAIALIAQPDRMAPRKLPRSALLMISGAVGLLAGLSGIGGGIFMAPVLHLIRWDNARRIAAFASIYILINSITGLAGQIIKSGPQSLAGPAFDYWPLLIAVFIGGQLGSMLGMKILTPRLLRTLTALLVGYAAIRLLWQGWGLI
ncbi:MAG: sulfite exporter TauE/SafE family protein [Sphingomonadaceae bacterium]|nr:sulfite exporter TauE/SafE family protein [Sphingomonadaceae bacterium]